MRINGSSIDPASNAAAERASAERPKVGTADNDHDGDGAGAVVVSANTSQLAAAADKGRANAADHVARVKSAVEAGTYKVDLDKLASRFVDEEWKSAK